MTALVIVVILYMLLRVTGQIITRKMLLNHSFLDFNE